MEEDTSTDTTKIHKVTETLTLSVKKFLHKLWNSLVSKTKRQPVTKLPFDLVEEILCRLPVKSLIRFRCVCKSWNSLISMDPKFAKKHLHIMSAAKHHHLITTTWILSRKELNVMSYPLDSLQLNSSFTPTANVSFDYSSIKQFYGSSLLVGSCDGLVCFVINPRLTVIWNPSTRKLKEFPSLQNPPGYSTGFTNYAFGYDPFIHKYKVVSVFCYDCQYVGNHMKHCKTQVKVYTLGTDSWRRIQDFPSTKVPRGWESGIIVSGSVNWFAYSRVTDSFSSRTIVSLDLGKESYKDVSQPDYGASVKLTMGVMRDCLCIFSYSNSFIDVWLMKEYGNKESWIKLIRLPIFACANHVNYIDNPKIVYIFQDDNHVLLLFEDFSKLKWLVYDAKNDTIKSLNIQDFISVDPTVYVESLISP